MGTNGFQQSAYNKYSSSTNQNDIDMGNDVIKSGNIFLSDPKKHEDLKVMLESSKDSPKLEAMKRIITMVAKGKDCSELFPSVVKNVVSKNAEVKKLVYAYLTRYAEEKQDLALLSISTFQRALKDPNQLIRGSALRVLSSIRVPMIVPIMMLSIKECTTDMSPYVRKIAAHAIPKMYSLDPATKEQLIEVIEKLLADKTTLVAGSVIQAFEEVCPDRLDLIHKHYRKLCSLLIDVEEWGQIVIINMLTRYARTQFLDPNLIDVLEKDKKFYSDEEDNDSSSNSDDENSETKKSKQKVMDSDHRLLLNSVKPLLQSRNSAVVMSVVQLYYHCASTAEMNVVVRSLIRLLKSNREVQYIVLNNIATMTTTRPELFMNQLKSFYVYNSDSIQVKLLKLEILTNLANESNISVVLRELQSYVGNTDQEFVKATIQAIGRCASNISEVSDNCLSGLVQLISRKDENIVAEAVVVIRKLLQMQSCDHRDIIINMAMLLDSINVPMAKASIIWLIGEYCDRVPKLAPDVLRKAAKTFVDEKEIVKLQTINLASKLYITNPKQSHLCVQYVLNLAKYDLNYDIRDRARFVRALLFPPTRTENNGEDAENGSTTQVSFLSKKIKKIFLATKPAPLLESNFKDRHYYQLGTMSHILNHRVPGYKELPDWPLEAPDPSVRHVEEVKEEYPISGGGLFAPENLNKKSKKKNKKSTVAAFYSDEEDSEDEESSDEDEDEDEESGEESPSEASDEDESEEDEDEEASNSEESTKEAKSKLSKLVTETKPKEIIVAKSIEISNKSDTETESSEEEEESSSKSEEEDEDESSSSDEPVPPPKKAPITKSGKSGKSKAPEIDLLLDFGDLPQTAAQSPGFTQTALNTQSVLKPSMIDQIMSQENTNKMNSKSSLNDVVLQDCYIPNDVPIRCIDIISKYSNSFVSVQGEFTRSLSVTINNSKLVCLNLVITNVCEDTLHNIQVLSKSPSVELECFSQIVSILPEKTVSVILGIDFKDSSQPVRLTLGFSTFIKCSSEDIETPRASVSSDGTSPSSGPKHIEQEKKLELTIKAPIGELLQSTTMTEKEFLGHQKKLRGMNESSISFELESNKFPSELSSSSSKELNRSSTRAVYSVCNVITVSSTCNNNMVIIRFAGVWSSSQLPCLLELQFTAPVDNQVSSIHCEIKVNSEQLTLISQLGREIKDAIHNNIKS